MMAGPLVAAILGRPRPRLTEWSAPPPESSPPVSVVVPARNEQENIERCLRSLASSAYPHFEVIVVDDRSTDRTAEIVERITAADGRVRLVRGAELPEGWFGKSWACWQGYREARHDILLFTDADTKHGPQVLGRAVAVLEGERADLVSLMPRQEMDTFWERAVQPLVITQLSIFFGTLGRVNRNTNPRRAIANGQFIMVTRESYESVGGHRAVGGTVIEDMMLARAYLAAGRRHRVVLADEEMATRMYSSLGGIVEGWSKNMFAGTRATLRWPSLTHLVMALALLWPALALLPVAAGAVGLVTGSGALVAFGLTGFAAWTFLIAHFLRLNGVSGLWGIAHPAGAAALAYIVVRAALRGTRRIDWRGRTYT